MIWSRLASFIRAKPKIVLAISLAILVPPALAVTKTRTSYNVLSELPGGADSVRGYNAIAGHFARGDLSPVVVVITGEGSLWSDEAFRAINDLTVAVGKIPGVERVRSLTQPTGGTFSEADLKDAGVPADFAKFPDRLQEGADGVGKVIDGLKQIRGGLVQMRDGFPELRDGLSEGAAGAVKMQDGIRAIRDGLDRMRAGLTEAADGLNRPGANNDLADAASTARDHAKDAFDELYSNSLATSKADPAVQRATCHAGVAYGALTGRNPIDDSYATDAPSTGGLCDAPPGGDDSSLRRYADAGGMAGTLRTIASGLRGAVRGIDRIDDGLAQIDTGLAKLGPGLQDASAAVATSIAGLRRMVDGLDQIVPGLGRLRAGLAEGAARVRAAGFGDIASAGNLGLTPGLISSIEGMRERLAFFLSSDERVTRLLVTFTREPYHAGSLAAVEEIRRAGALALNKTPLEGRPVLVGGPAAFFDDIRSLSKADFDTIVMAVLIGIFFVLALLLRSLVAPTYLIFTVLLSFLSTLGLTVIVFQGIFGFAGVPWWLPPFLFVLLVALGADYNIFLMSRIREEARTATTADATARGLALTGHVITSAGIILAGTFAALLFAPMKGLQQMGFATTVGILLDTFVVRSLLVPSLATLLGRHNWWPSSRAHAP